jgi:hypothetical protein
MRKANMFCLQGQRLTASLIVLISYLRRVNHTSHLEGSCNESHGTELESGISGFVVVASPSWRLDVAAWRFRRVWHKPYWACGVSQPQRMG